jgi:hypothetical protein
MMRLHLLLSAALLAAVTPLTGSRVSPAPTTDIPPWPHELQGRPLTRVPLSEQERGFLAGFPGDVARFSDGQSDVVLRWVTQPTRRLHPAEDCFRGLGFEVGATRIHADRDGANWRCFEATRAGTTRSVCEQLRDTDGVYWTDVSSWYWAATLHRTRGPWLVTTIAR